MHSDRVRDVDISGIRKMFECAGEDAINLGLGEPDFDTPSHIKEAAIRALNEGHTHYTPSMGIPELREAICEKLRRENGIDAEPSEVIVTSGASEALHIALEALLNVGEEVIVPDPGFVSYRNLTIFAGGKPIGVGLTEDFRMRAEDVAELITPKTKAIMINSPSNPTGAVLEKEDIVGICELAVDHEITIISDEVYEYLIYEGKHLSAGSIAPERTITVNGFSKSYAMTGWRLGYVHSNEDMIHQMLKVHQYIQACASSISQWAALGALRGSQKCVEEMREMYRKRRDVLMDELKKIGVKCVRPKGAFYAFPDVSSFGMDGNTLSQKLLERGVITVPGSSFGERGKNHIRISFSASVENIKKGIAIMKNVIER